MRYIFFSFLLVTILNSKNSTAQEDVIFKRIEYIYDLKSLTNQVWPGFNSSEYDLPLVYYTDSICYVSNPTDQFILLFKPELVFKTQRFSIYKSTLIDSIPFHMETSITLGDSTSDYNYGEPYMNCSSPEITNIYVPDVHSTEMWSTMVMHEYFHGFQFKHDRFLEFYEMSVNVSADTLKMLYRNNSWYQESVDKENNLLLTALQSESPSEIHQSIDQFFKLREKRFKQLNDSLRSDIKTIEKNYETMEGTARYIEYNLYKEFGNLDAHINLKKSDTLFRSYEYFNDYNMTNDKWLYMSGPNYFYAIGFNILRLLDKMGVDYKSRLFNEGVFIDDLLLEQIENSYLIERL
jgi:hypothetical protein